MELTVNDLIALAAAGGIGSGGGVFLVLKWQFKTLARGIEDAKQTATRAHSRIDNIMEKGIHHG